MSFEDPLSLNTVGMRDFDTAITAFEKADVIMLAGYDPPEFQPQFWNVGRPKTIVYVGEAPVGYAQNLHVNIQVLGGLRYMLKSLYRIGGAEGQLDLGHTGPVVGGGQLLSSGRGRH